MPQNLYITIDQIKYPLKKENDSLFSFYFPLIQQPITFYLSDNKYSIGNYKLNIIYPPQLLNFNLKVIFPSYLHLKPKVFNYAGNITVPQSSFIYWDILTSNADSITFSFNDKNFNLPLIKDKFTFKKQVFSDITYSFALKNKYLSLANSNVY